MQISEGTLTFVFNDDYSITKFDETIFYRRFFNKLPNAKGIDFLADSMQDTLLVEVKNCQGYERENRWRTEINKFRVVPPTMFPDNSFDIEVAQKIAMSLTCLYGAYTKHKNCESANNILPYYNGLTDKRIPLDRKKIKVIFFLEGNFNSVTRTKKMIMKRIQESLRTKLSWLYCDVHVVDSSTVSSTYFEVV